VTEYDLHLSVVKFLRMALGAGAVFFHCPNGGYRRHTEAQRFKAMGVIPGIPDIGIIWLGKIIWIELKAGKGKESDAQLYCHVRLRSAGSAVTVCRTLQEVIDVLVDAGVPMRIKVMVAA